MKSKIKIPENEASRLKALEHYRIIDTDAEEGFDRITRTAAAFFNTPIALVSLVDETRQWFKSKYGLEVSETPREIAFCAHTILDNETMVVPDTHQDSRFATSKLVLSDPNIRFYAGTPLRTPNGENLGTLCVIDTVPREFSEVEKRVLQDLSGLVIDQLELRLANIRVEEELARHTKNIEQLRDNQTRLNAIFNSTYDSILVLDQNGQIESHNLASEQLFGYNSSELIGLYAKTLMPDSFDTKVSTFFTEHQKSGISKYFIGGDEENIAVRKNGERFPVELSVSEMYLNNERHYCLIGRDISNKKRIERKLVDAVTISEKSTTAQRELLSSLSHEILTPLNAIIGFSELLMTDIENILTTSQRGHFHQIIEGGRQLTKTTQQLLEYSRRASQTLKLEVEELPIDKMIDECWAKLKWLANKKRIQYSFTVDPSRTIVIKSNKDSLIAVLNKLLSNAIKYCDQDGNIDISITPADEGFANIALASTGSGIDALEFDHLFDIFSNADANETDKSEISLALCRAIVQGMKGEIYVKNNKNNGCTFLLTLPMKFLHPTDDRATKSSERNYASDERENKNILYIGDDVTRIKSIEKALKARDEISLIFSPRGALGLALAIRSTPNLIILDTLFPEIEFHDVLAKLKAHVRTRKIPILLTGPTEIINVEHQNIQDSEHRYISADKIESALCPLIATALKSVQDQ